jgi:hypothetical protein
MSSTHKPWHLSTAAVAFILPNAFSASKLFCCTINFFRHVKSSTLLHWVPRKNSSNTVVSMNSFVLLVVVAVLLVVAVTVV